MKAKVYRKKQRFCESRCLREEIAVLRKPKFTGWNSINQEQKFNFVDSAGSFGETKAFGFQRKYCCKAETFMVEGLWSTVWGHRLPPKRGDEN